MSLRTMIAELRIIRQARQNGRRLGVQPELTDSKPIRDREAHLASVLISSTAREHP